MALRPPATFDAPTRVIFRQYALRQEEAGGDDEMDRPMLEMAATLQRRLNQIRDELDKLRAANGGTLRVASLRGTYTTDPLLGHEREYTVELRLMSKLLADRALARVKRVPSAKPKTLDQKLGPPVRLKGVA